METRWLAKDSTRGVAVYLVWSPQRGGQEHNVDPATTLIPDQRVRHFWDPGRIVGKAFEPVVGSGGPAWDVWMLFAPDASWPATGAPTPAWWEHQLGGLPTDRYLDPGRFATKAAEIEASPR